VFLLCNKKVYGRVPLQLGSSEPQGWKETHSGFVPSNTAEDSSLSAKVSKPKTKTRGMHSKQIPQRWHSDLLRDGVLPNPSVSQLSMNHPRWTTRTHTLGTHRIVRKELHNGLRLDNFASVGLQSRRVRYLNSCKFWMLSQHSFCDSRCRKL